jgi:hypothetical protein
MPILNIGGQSVNVNNDFLRLSPDQQDATVDEIARSIGVKGGAKKPGIFDDIAPATEAKTAPGMFDDIQPAVPPGFVLDKAPTAGLPPGFVLDEPRNSVTGSAKAIGSGLAGGVLGLAGQPGDVKNAIFGALGEPPAPNPAPEGAYGKLVSLLERARGALELPTSNEVRNAVEREPARSTMNRRRGLSAF